MLLADQSICFRNRAVIKYYILLLLFLNFLEAIYFLSEASSLMKKYLTSSSKAGNYCEFEMYTIDAYSVLF